jgi:hypothetical protein
MPGEFENPERRYRGFRPRQAASSYFVPTTPTNRATHSLYNNSTGSQWLVVRHIDAQSAGSCAGGFQNNTIGSSSGNVTTIVPNERTPPGQHFYQDVATISPYTFLFTAPNAVLMWSHDFPAAFIPPGWSFFIQALTSAAIVGVSFFWEYVFAEEVDYIW